MVKIRLMGKKEDFYMNKGTSKYGRIYMEVEPRK